MDTSSLFCRKNTTASAMTIKRPMKGTLGPLDPLAAELLSERERSLLLLIVMVVPFLRPSVPWADQEAVPR